MIKFLVFSDLHYDEVTDGDKRIENNFVLHNDKLSFELLIVKIRRKQHD